MRSIYVADTNLFTVAAAELLDATAWDQIAQLNGLVDPVIIGVMQLLIPNPASMPLSGASNS